MTEAYVAFGANVGEPARVYEAAAAALRRHSRIESVRPSPLYRTQPVGPIDQPPYLNGAYAIRTSLGAHALFEFLVDLETRFGRVRTLPWGPRPIDLDLLLFGSQTVVEPELLVPHPRLHHRRFVLRPLADLTQTARHPLLGVSVGELARWVEAADPGFLVLGSVPDLVAQIAEEFPGRTIVHCPPQEAHLDMREIGGWIVGVALSHPSVARLRGEHPVIWCIVVEPVDVSAPGVSGSVIPAADCRAPGPSPVLQNVGYFFRALAAPDPV